MSGKERESGVGAKAERSRMGDLLLEMGLLDEQTLSAAMAEQRLSGRRLPRILGEKRVLDEERLTKAVAAKLGLEVVNVSSLKIHERVLALIPAQIAVRYGVLPIAIKRANGAEFLYLVMADPLDTEAIGEVQKVTGRQVRVLMASASDVDSAIDAQYRALQGKHVPPMNPPPAQPPPAAQPAVLKQGNLQNARRAEPTPPPQRANRSLSTPRAVDPATGGPTELVRPSQLPKAYAAAPQAPARATPTPVPRHANAPAAAVQPAPSPPRGTPAQKPSVQTARAPAPAPAPQAMQGNLQRRGSKAEPFRMAAQDLIHPMPLDAPGEEPKTRIDDPAQEDWDLAVRDWSPATPFKALSQPAGAHQLRDEPVTTEAKLIGSEADHDEPFELIEIEAEEVSTSQIELEELSEAQVIAMQAQPVHLVPPSPIELVRAFEIPIDVDEPHHPFEGPKPDEVPTGLERTGIIPAIDWSSERFEPPPLPESGKPNRALIGGDIPTSKAAVEARSTLASSAPVMRTQDTQEAPTLDFVAALEMPAAEPKKRKPDDVEKMERSTAKGALTQSDDSDSDAMPVIEPSSLMSLMDYESPPEDTGSDDVPSHAADLIMPAPATRLFDESKRKKEEAPKPGIETSAEQTMIAQQPSHVLERDEQMHPPEVDRDAVLSALDGQFAEAIPFEQPVELTEVATIDADERARDLVRALMQGRSLKSAERAELVLAIGRLLIKNGVIDEEELAIELTLDADE